MRALITVCLVAVLSSGAFADESSTTRHLLAGVRAFKAARYEDALVELRVVARASDAPDDLAFYLGPTLYKLGRYREAVVVFIASRAQRDALSGFYLGQAYYQLQLYRKARQVFASLRSQGLGPALEAAAARYVDAVDLVYESAPDIKTVDVYIAEAARDTDPIVAGEILDEARQVEALAPVRHRRGEILAALGAAWNATGHGAGVVEALSPEPSLPAEARWQLARAYVTVGDAAHARPLLEALAADKRNARATEAAALLATSTSP